MGKVIHIADISDLSEPLQYLGAADTLSNLGAINRQAFNIAVHLVNLMREQGTRRVSTTLSRFRRDFILNGPRIIAGPVSDNPEVIINALTDLHTVVGIQSVLDLRQFDDPEIADHHFSLSVDRAFGSDWDADTVIHFRLLDATKEDYDMGIRKLVNRVIDKLQMVILA